MHEQDDAVSWDVRNFLYALSRHGFLRRMSKRRLGILERALQDFARSVREKAVREVGETAVKGSEN